MSNIVLILGDLAAGKSTLADNLSAKLNYVCLKKDIIKEKISDIIGFNNREENRKLSIASVDIMTYVLENILKVDGNAILEANFRKNEVNSISCLAKKYNAKLEIIYLYGEYSIIYKRFIERLPYRNKTHLSMNLDKDFEAFKSYINEIRDNINNIDAYKIDTSTLNEEGVTKSVINYLRDKNF